MLRQMQNGSDALTDKGLVQELSLSIIFHTHNFQ